MSEGLLLLLLVIGGVVYWKTRREQDWGYLHELRVGISGAVERLRENSAEREAVQLERMSDNIQEGIAACARKRRLSSDEFQTINRDVLSASNDDVLNRANIFNATGRRDRTKEALYALSKQLTKLRA